MQDQQLSKSFWLREFLRSETAARMGRAIKPTEQEIANLRLLCENILQPIRDQLNRPITITSGLRPPWLNLAIGGATDSEHIAGRAADFVVASYTPYAACQAIESMQLPWNQLIHEFGQWTHVSVPPAGVQPRRKVKTAQILSGRTAYTPGVVDAICLQEKLP